VETKWLEDFVSLAETRSFSRSAQLRHVTQPAFSRRIQALEAWAGVDLVDRSSYPTRLTPAGQTLLPQALEVLGGLQAARNLMRGHQSTGQDMIEFAVPHSLAFTFFPHWVMELRQSFGAFKSRLVGLNVHDAVMQLTEGSCDLLLAYHHPSQPLQLNPERYEMLSLGHETLAPYAKADADGQPLFRLPGRQLEPVPYLAYAPQLALGRLVEDHLAHHPEAPRLQRLVLCDSADAHYEYVQRGLGVAWLPWSMVHADCKSGRLACAGGPQMEVRFDVHLYRPKRRLGPLAEAVWDAVMQR